MMKASKIIFLCLVGALFLVILWSVAQLFTSTLGLSSRSVSELPSFDGTYSSAPSGEDKFSKTITTEGRKVSYTGELSLFVDNAAETTEKITHIADDMEGFVTQSRVYESSSHTKAGNITIQVPATRFRDAMNALKGLAVEVESESITKTDVTDQYVDMEKRLRSLRGDEMHVLEIQKRANTVEEILSVRRHLNDLQSQIEGYEGQLKYITGKVAMSSITAQLTAEADVKVFGIRWRPLYTAKKSLRGLVAGVANYIDWLIWFILLLPVMLLWGGSIVLLILVIWKILLWLRGKMFPRMPIS